jgi:hypothetical protein
MRRVTAFDVFNEMFEDHLKASITYEVAFENASQEWRESYGFEPPAKTYQSFKVRRCAMIRKNDVVKKPKRELAPNTYAGLTLR